MGKRQAIHQSEQRRLKVINNIEGQSKSELIKIVTEQQSHDIQREAYIKSLQSESDDLRTQLAKANERVKALESQLEQINASNGSYTWTKEQVEQLRKEQSND